MSVNDTTLAFAADDRYAEYMLIALYSALRNMTGDFNGVRWHYFTGPQGHPDVRQTIDAHFDAFAQAFGGSGQVDIIRADNLPKDIPPLDLSNPTLFRLYLAHFLGGEVVYLDPDILVLGDIKSALAQTDLGEHVFGAVTDQGLVARVKKALSPMGKLRKSLTGLGVSKGAGQELVDLLGVKQARRYFNAGVMVIDLDRWKARGCDRLLVEIGDASQFRYFDQDALNALATKLGGYHPLSEFWNVHRETFGPEVCDGDAGTAPAIKHYIGPRKPWLSDAQDAKGHRGAWNRLYGQYQQEIAVFRRQHKLVSPQAFL